MRIIRLACLFCIKNIYQLRSTIVIYISGGHYDERLEVRQLEDSFASKSSIPRRLPHTPVERNDGAFIVDAGNCMVIVDAFGQYSLRVRHGLHRVSGIQVCIALS